MPFFVNDAAVSGGKGINYQRMGRGVLRTGLSITANTDTTIAHNLGRIPTMVLVWSRCSPAANPPSVATYTPKLKPSIVTAWTKTNITIQSDTTFTDTNGTLVFWII
jgi:hypothetical protein